MIRKTRTPLTLFAATAFASVAGLAVADTELHGRVSFTDQSALVKGTSDADWSYAGVNSLIMPGDSIWADDKSALEIEFSGGTFLRLADGSRLDVIEVPPSALFSGATGSFYVHRVRRSNGDVTFDTPVGAIEVAPDSQVRVDILEEGVTTVTVRWGKATIHAEGGAPVSLSTGERSFIDPGYLPSTPVVFDRNQEDEFDTWSRSRARQLAEGSTGAPIESTYTNGTAPLGMSDLNSNGEWVYIDNTPYWRPTVADYVPYRNGSWSYVPAQGYVWVDYYPWAYTTTHYGYWSYRPRYGWCWSYAGYYRPAYAYTLRYGDRFVWAPLSVYGYPVCYDSYAGFTIGGISFSYGFSSYCYDSYVWGGGYHYVWGVDYDCIYDRYDRYRYNDCDYWRIDTDDRPYENAGQPHWPGGRSDTFAPDRVYRGAPVKPDGATRARDRAQTLEARNPSARTNQGNPVVRTARTNESRPASPARANGGRTRDVRLTDPSATRLARGTDLVRQPGDGQRDRSFSNDDARGAAPLSRGSLAERPSAPSDRTSATRNADGLPSDRGRPASPVDSPRTTRPSVDSSNPDRGSSSRPVATRPSRPADVDRQDSPAERPRPTTSRPTQSRPQPSAPSVEDRPTERPRPTTTRPQVAESERQQYTRPESQRPVYNQPSAERPQVQSSRPTYERSQPQVSRPEPQRPTYDRVQQPQVSRPESQRPSYERQQPVSRPAPQPRVESQPQRQSAPSYSAPSSAYRGSSGGGGGGGGAPPSRSSGGGGPSRSPR